MDELLKDLEDAAREWPEDHRLAKACRDGADVIRRLVIRNEFLEVDRNISRRMRQKMEADIDRLRWELEILKATCVPIRTPIRPPAPPGDWAASGSMGL